MITDEDSYFKHRRKQANIEEKILRFCRSPANTVADLLLAECHIRSLQLQHDIISEALATYDAKHHADRHGEWMPLYSGKRFWPQDPRPQDIDITDIAHSLSNICRWNGHTRSRFSVAQHSIMVSRILPPHLQLFGLLHDAGECYLGDTITPLKQLHRGFYESFEEPVMDAVAKKFGFTMSVDDRALVKRADLVLLATETRDLTVYGFVTQKLTELPLTERIGRPWTSQFAKKQFLAAFHAITGQTNG